MKNTVNDVWVQSPTAQEFTLEGMDQISTPSTLCCLGNADTLKKPLTTPAQ